MFHCSYFANHRYFLENLSYRLESYGLNYMGRVGLMNDVVKLQYDNGMKKDV